jgi:hypothetical protein
MDQPNQPLTPEQVAARKRLAEARQQWEAARNRAIRSLLVVVAVVAVLWYLLSR